MGTNSQRSAVAGAMRSDVKHKISKLEADSRQLCLNLRNLQKNRAELTNEAVALSQELENPTFRSEHEETIYSEPDCIRVLLGAKHIQNDCCTICTCSECGDYSEIIGDNEGKDLEESLIKKISAEELKGHECCYICFKNGATDSGYIEKSAANIGNELNELKSNESKENVNFCSTCIAEGQFCNNRCEICDCELINHKKYHQVLNDSLHTVPEAEERCRGGMDRIESKLRSATRNSGDMKNKRKKRMCEGCECNLCAIRNVEGASPPCLMMCESSGRLSEGNIQNTITSGISSGDAPAKLQQICKVEKLREVLEQLKNRNHALRKMLNDCDCLSQSSINFLAPEKSANDFEDIQEGPEARDLIARSTSGLIATVKLLQNKCRTKDGMILALAEALKKLASSDQTDRILKKLTNPCTDDSPIRDLDRSELWKLLQMENPQKQIRDERECLESVRQDERDERDLSEEPSNCGCATYTEVLPPRDLKIVEKIGADTLVITWEPPETGPVNAYKIFVDEQLVARLRAPLRRTEATLRNLDLASSRLIEILAIDSMGFSSSTIEKLYDPVRFERSKAR